MISVRAGIVRSAFYALAKGVTIATRYSCVRRQFALLPSNEQAGGSGGAPRESAVLDYKMQQWRLLPHLAVTFALRFTSEYLTRMYETMQAALLQGDLR